MKIRELRDEDLVDAVRILALCFEKELITIFRDLDLAREILKEFFKEHKEGCYVAEDGRVLAFAWLLSEKPKILKFLKSQVGFLNALRAYLLLKFFLRSQKNGEVYLAFIAVSPLRQRAGIGSALMNEIIKQAKFKNFRSMNCIVQADSEAVLFFKNLGFEIRNFFENRLAEKYFSAKEWVLLSKDLSAR
ncbi:MAG: GNAT family N-acetyltransferase [Archaeoglobaceae archaeon]|nr:GNAT family N-acetyltransferase [Archaeoglobaceae archaeon]MDW8128819.1 N-acetyltransferase [Archaeoglobaceae archaeon]